MFFASAYRCIVLACNKIYNIVRVWSFVFTIHTNIRQKYDANISKLRKGYSANAVAHKQLKNESKDKINSHKNHYSKTFSTVSHCMGIIIEFFSIRIVRNGTTSKKKSEKWKARVPIGITETPLKSSTANTMGESILCYCRIFPKFTTYLASFQYIH